MAEVVPLFEDGGGPVSPDAAAIESFETWNTIAKAAGWPEARYLTDSRRTALRRAIRDAGGLVGWKTLLEEAAQSSFLTGKTERTKSQNWRFTLDWLLKPANFVKVLEGSYQDAAYQAPPSKGERPVVNWRARLETYRPMGFWLQSDGPRPEEPGPHQAPADMITAWRQRTGAAKVILAPPLETAEERMRATVEMYRRHGREADAQRVELKLAALVGPSGGVRDGSRAPSMQDDSPSDHIASPPSYDYIPEGDDYGAE